MTGETPRPDAVLSETEFDELARGTLAPTALERLRSQVQAVLDDPSDGVSHDAVWSRLERRMKRAARAA